MNLDQLKPELKKIGFAIFSEEKDRFMAGIGLQKDEELNLNAYKTSFTVIDKSGHIQVDYGMFTNHYEKSFTSEADFFRFVNETFSPSDDKK
jgi:hypothetical protein